MTVSMIAAILFSLQLLAGLGGCYGQWLVDCQSDMSMSVTFDNGVDYYAVYSTFNELGCLFEDVSTQTTSYTRSIDLVNEEAKCGVTKNVTLADRIIYSVDVIARKDPYILQATDQRYVLSCVYTLGSVTISSSDVINIDIANDAFYTDRSNVALANAPIEMSFGSLGNSGAITEGQVGDKVSVVLEMLNNANYKSFRVSECSIFESKSKKVIPPIGLISRTGCGFGTLIPSDQGFSPVVFSSSNLRTESPHFELFKYKGYNELYVECVIQLCKTWDDPRCQKNSCLPSIQDGDTYDGVQVVSRSFYVPSDTGDTLNQASSECKQTPSYLGLIIALAVLVFLLLLLLVVALLYIRRKRQRLQHRQQILESITNPFVDQSEYGGDEKMFTNSMSDMQQPAFSAPPPPLPANRPTKPASSRGNTNTLPSASTLQRSKRIVTANNGMTFAPESQKTLYEQSGFTTNGLMNDFQPSDQIYFSSGLYGIGGSKTLGRGISVGDEPPPLPKPRCQTLGHVARSGGFMSSAGTSLGAIYDDDSEVGYTGASSYIHSKPNDITMGDQFIW